MSNPAAQNDNRPVAVASNTAAGDNKALTFVSMFSGIEAASVAFGPLGWKALAFAEIEKFPSAVLAHHYPDVPNVGDMTAHDWSQYRGKVDIVCGGPPCQAFSVAGLRNSMADARGNLSLSYMRALHAIKPRNAIVENVPGWLNTPDNAFGCFLAGLVGADAPLVSSLKRGRWPDAGMVAGPEGRAAWRILDAQYFGLAQRRRRVIVIADFGIGADPAAVLFVEQGLRRHSPPSREAGEGVTHPIAPSLVSSGRGVGRTGDTRGQDPVVAYYAPQIARCVATREGSSQDYESTTMVAVGGGGDKPHVLTSQVRRLTPRECERLQGFQWLCSPDYPGAWQDEAGRWWSPDYTNIPWRGKPFSPDGPRYKSLGNSWAVPKFTWLGRRIQQFMPQVAANDNHASTPISANRSHA